ncbi:hypothetical protein VE03_00614 [Pseudogymnoascus sp. 23342-1-I1]|nr:hypothetical protein VE03_00614 [Pseudogymnoascus sp. 23342-1-I1]
MDIESAPNKDEDHFQLLPTEIRIMIWKLAIQDAPGRNILLRYSPSIFATNGMSLDEIPFPLFQLSPPVWDLRLSVTSATQIPGVLQTCHLSRLLALERWSLDMATYAGVEKRVYVDLKTDSLYFMNGTFMTIWHRNGAWADLMQFVYARLYVVRDADLGDGVQTTAPAYLSYSSPVLTLTVISEEGSVSFPRYQSSGTDF